MDSIRNVAFDPCSSSWARTTFVNDSVSLDHRFGHWTKSQVNEPEALRKGSDCWRKGFVVSSRHVHFPHISEQLFQMLELALTSTETFYALLLLPRFHDNAWISGLFQSVGDRVVTIDLTCLRSEVQEAKYCFHSLFYFPQHPTDWFRTADGCIQMRSMVLKGLNLTTNGGTQAVILNRKKSRSIHNIEEVAAVVRRYLKVEPIILDFDNSTFAQQVSNISTASYLFAAHGAALTNIVFLRPTAMVVEFFPYNYVPSPKWYDRLATQCGHYHIPIFSGRISQVKHSKCFWKYQNFTVTDCRATYACRACMRNEDIIVDAKVLVQAIGKLT